MTTLARNGLMSSRKYFQKTSCVISKKIWGSVKKPFPALLSENISSSPRKTLKQSMKFILNFCTELLLISSGKFLDEDMYVTELRRV